MSSASPEWLPALLGPAQADDLASIHAASLPHGWSRESFDGFLRDPCCRAAGVAAGGRLAGFILLRIAADEAEILTFAVLPAARRRGMGAALLREGMRLAAQGGAAKMFLEVAADNAPALALYRGHGFAETGCRPGYYASGVRPGAAAKDGLILSRDVQAREAGNA